MAKYGEAAKVSFKISPPDHYINAPNKDCALMQEMFFDKPPEFNCMMFALQAWKTQFNRA